MTEVTSEGLPASYLRIVQRGVSILVGKALLAMALAPSLLLLNFLVHRAAIERELCVQREVTPDMRTCHGECHLSKQLRALEREAGREFPVELPEMRIDPMVEERMAPETLLSAASPRSFPRFIESVSDGFAATLDHVPWS